MTLATDVANANAAAITLAGSTLTATDMVRMIDVAIATALATGGIPCVQSANGDKSVSISYDQARALRDYYYRIAVADDSGELVVGAAEFSGTSW